MKYVLIIILVLSTILSGCVKEGEKCKNDTDCLVPIEYAVQSNCPFMSICLQGTCTTACPIIKTCDTKKQCNCDERGNRSEKCVCHNYECFSLE